MLDWTPIRALTFDCYGTLIDWEKGIVRDLRAGLTTRSGKPVDYEDEELLRFWSQAEPAAQSGPFKSYRDVLKRALLRLSDSAHLRIVDPDILGKGLPTWPPFPDTVAALTALKARFRLCVVSNVDRDLFDGTAAVLGVPFDAVVTADEVQSYKPARRHFDEALTRLKLGQDAIVHVAQSLFHDIEPAHALGWKTVHIDRRAGRQGGATPGSNAPVTPDLRVQSLGDLATACGLA